MGRNRKLYDNIPESWPVFYVTIPLPTSLGTHRNPEYLVINTYSWDSPPAIRWQRVEAPVGWSPALHLHLWMTLGNFLLSLLSLIYSSSKAWKVSWDPQNRWCTMKSVRCSPGFVPLISASLLLPVPAAALSLQSVSHWREDSSLPSPALPLLSKIAQALHCLARPSLIYLVSLISKSDSAAAFQVSFPPLTCNLRQVSPLRSVWVAVLFPAHILNVLGAIEICLPLLLSLSPVCFHFWTHEKTLVEASFQPDFCDLSVNPLNLKLGLWLLSLPLCLEDSPGLEIWDSVYSN